MTIEGHKPQPAKTKETPIDMEAFYAEIGELVESVKSGRLSRFPELLKVNDVRELKEEDARMWYQVKNYTHKGDLEREAFNTYRQSCIATKDTPENNARKQLAAIMVHKLTPIWMQEDLDEMEEEAK